LLLNILGPMRLSLPRARTHGSEAGMLSMLPGLATQ
jgi:hypothetical protein